MPPNIVSPYNFEKNIFYETLLCVTPSQNFIRKKFILNILHLNYKQY